MVVEHNSTYPFTHTSTENGKQNSFERPTDRPKDTLLHQNTFPSPSSTWNQHSPSNLKTRIQEDSPEHLLGADDSPYYSNRFYSRCFLCSPSLCAPAWCQNIISRELVRAVEQRRRPTVSIVHGIVRERCALFVLSCRLAASGVYGNDGNAWCSRNGRH